MVELLCKELRPGVVIKDAHAKVMELCTEKGQSFLQHLSRVFGSGIGLQKKESGLELSDENETVIEEGMVFGIRISLTGFNDKAEKATMMIGDTVIVNKNENVVVTEGISKKYQDISYVLDDDDDDEEDDDDEINVNDHN